MEFGVRIPLLILRYWWPLANAAAAVSGHFLGLFDNNYVCYY